MELPSMKYAYLHSIINGVSIGPGRSVTLSIEILQWTDLQWTDHVQEPSPAQSVCFGGVINIEDVRKFFRHHQRLDLAYLCYSGSYHSIPDHLFFELHTLARLTEGQHAARTADRLEIQCSSIRVSSYARPFAPLSRLPTQAPLDG